MFENHFLEKQKNGSKNIMCPIIMVKLNKMNTIRFWVDHKPIEEDYLLMDGAADGKVIENLYRTKDVNIRIVISQVPQLE